MKVKRVDEEQERELFEVYAHGNLAGRIVREDGEYMGQGEYMDRDVREAWYAWLARALVEAER